jgi:hypothetical protein
MKQAESRRFAEDFSLAYLGRVATPISAVFDRRRTNQQSSLDDSM